MMKPLKKKLNGFTLVELMTVVAILGLILAISLPNLLRAKISGNEAAAIATLEAIGSALEDYYLTQSPTSYPQDLTPLATANPPYLTQELVNSSTTDPTILLDLPGVKGYVYRYQAESAEGDRLHGFAVAAVPKTKNITGCRYFYINTAGVVVETDEENATNTIELIAPPDLVGEPSI